MNFRAFVSCVVVVAFPGRVAAQSKDSLPYYEVGAQVDPKGGSIDATVMVRIPGGSAAQRFWLGPTYAIRAMRAEGGTLDTSTVDAPIKGLRQLTLTPTGATPAVMHLTYGGRLFELSKPAINVINDSLVELTVDSFWLPYNASLGSPFRVAAFIRGLPARAVIASNVLSKVEHGVLQLSSTDGTADLAFVAATNLTAREELRFRVLAADHSSPMTRYYTEHGGAGIRFLEQILGPMPGSSATISIVRRESGRGYARPGHVVVTEVPGATPNAGQAKFIVHEFAHLWFSRAPIGGEDYWLSETPAEYLGLRYVSDMLGVAAFDGLMQPKLAAAATAPPVLGRTERAPDATLYSKGPILLFDLERRIGRAKLDDVLGRLAGQPRHTTRLFLSTLRSVAGEVVATEFEKALRQ